MLLDALTVGATVEETTSDAEAVSVDEIANATELTLGAAADDTLDAVTETLLTLAVKK